MFDKESGPPEMMGYEATLGLMPILAVCAVAFVVAVLSCMCQRWCPRPKCFKMNVSVFVFLIAGSFGAIVLAASTLYYAKAPDANALSCTVVSAVGEARVSPTGLTSYAATITAQYFAGDGTTLQSGRGVYTTESQQEYVDYTTSGNNVTCYVLPEDPTSIYFEPPKNPTIVEYIVIACAGTVLVMAMVACCLSCSGSKKDDTVYKLREKDANVSQADIPALYDPFATYEDQQIQKAASQAQGLGDSLAPPNGAVKPSRSTDHLLTRDASEVSLALNTPSGSRDGTFGLGGGGKSTSNLGAAVGATAVWKTHGGPERRARSQEEAKKKQDLPPLAKGINATRSEATLSTFGAVATVAHGAARMKQSAQVVARRSEHTFEY